jgi:hypothetical protein
MRAFVGTPTRKEPKLVVEVLSIDTTSTLRS